MKTIWRLTVVACVVAGGCSNDVPTQNPAMPSSVLSDLQNAKEFELFSLYPNRSNDEHVEASERFLGFKVLGKTTVNDSGTRQKLIDALHKAASVDPGYKCFDPQHGIRATTDGGTKTDYGICFDCGHVYYLRQGEQDTRKFNVSVSREPFDVFQGVLKDAGVRLSAPPRTP